MFKTYNFATMIDLVLSFIISTSTVVVLIVSIATSVLISCPVSTSTVVVLIVSIATSVLISCPVSTSTVVVLIVSIATSVLISSVGMWLRYGCFNTHFFI